MIVSAWVLIWIYVRWANSHYDDAVVSLRGQGGSGPRGGEAMSTSLGEPNVVAILFFFAFVAVTLGITWWAARRTQSTEHFYAAGRSVTGVQNGFALAGDYMSAASFLGIAGLVSLSGYDGLIYAIGFLVGWPVVMFLIAEPLRNLGRYTFSDVVAYRLRQAPVRMAAALGTLAVVTFYLIAQMVGAGNLVKLLFGIPYETAIVIVGDGDDRVRALRRDAGHHLGPDREGRPAPRRRLRARRARPAAVRGQPPQRCSPPRPTSSGLRCSPRASSSRTPSTRSRSASP